MLRPGELARPAAAKTFTTELAWAGSPLCPRRLLLDGLIVIYHRRTFTGWTGSLMGCKRIDTKLKRDLTQAAIRKSFVKIRAIRVKCGPRTLVWTAMRVCFTLRSRITSNMRKPISIL